MTCGMLANRHTPIGACRRKAYLRIHAYALEIMMPLALLSALSEPTRLGAIRILADGQEHCVCQLMARLDATQSRMSRHMQTLKQAGLVVDRRDAQWVRYRLNPSLPAAVRRLLDAALDLPPDAGRIAA
jgi:ArsR family transcriptional regulator